MGTGLFWILFHYYKQQGDEYPYILVKISIGFLNINSGVKLQSQKEYIL